MSDSDEDAAIALWNHGGLDGAFPTSKDSHGNARPFHAAPRVRVDVASARGKGAKARDVERIARSKGYWPIRLCFERELRHDQKLTATIELEVRIAANGTVRRAREVGAKKKDAQLGSCVREAVKGIAFGPMPRKGATATLQVSLWPGDAPVYEPDEAGAAASFDSAALGRALETKLPDVRACFRAGLAEHPGLWGRLGVKLHFDGDGSVASASEIESHFPDSKVSRCVLDAVATVKIPPPRAPFDAVWPLRLGRVPSPSTAEPESQSAH